MTISLIRLGQQNSLAWIHLQRPKAYSAFTPEMTGELLEHLFRIRQDTSVRVVVITGEGSVLCAGGDLKQVSSYPQGINTAFYELATRVHVCITEIRRFPKPILVVINGTAAGGGFPLALDCDFQLVVRSTPETGPHQPGASFGWPRNSVSSAFNRTWPCHEDRRIG